jgi:hypothetical protein
MRPTTDLGKFRDAINGRLRRIRKVYSSVSLPLQDSDSRSLAFSIVELDNLVLGGIREFTISTLRRARTAAGYRVSVNQSFGAEGEIAAYMMSVVQNYIYVKMGNPTSLNRRQEPKIRDPRDTEKILVSCNASNLASVQTALSLNTTLFSDLATVRNFYAHRNEDTWMKVRNRAQNLGVFGLDHPDGFVTYKLPARPVSIFEDWLDDAELFFHELTQ